MKTPTEVAVTSRSDIERAGIGMSRCCFFNQEIPKRCHQNVIRYCNERRSARVLRQGPQHGSLCPDPSRYSIGAPSRANRSSNEPRHPGERA